MTPDQIDAVNQEIKRHVVRMRSIGRRPLATSESKGGPLSPPERPQALQPQQRQQFVSEETDEAIARLLTESQRTRLSELCAQYLGPSIFRDVTIRRELEISEAQQKGIDQLFQELSFLSYEANPGRRRFKRLNPTVRIAVVADEDKERVAEEFRAKIKELNEIAKLEILDLLEEKQRVEFAVRVGEPAAFDVTSLKFELKVPLAPEPEPEIEPKNKE